MADMEDILGKPKEEDTFPVGGMCEYQIGFGEFCYYPYEYGSFDPKRNEMTFVCVQGHKTTVPWGQNG